MTITKREIFDWTKTINVYLSNGPVEQEEFEVAQSATEALEGDDKDFYDEFTKEIEVEAGVLAGILQSAATDIIEKNNLPPSLTSWKQQDMLTFLAASNRYDEYEAISQGIISQPNMTVFFDALERQIDLG